MYGRDHLCWFRRTKDGGCGPAYEFVAGGAISTRNCAGPAHTAVYGEGFVSDGVRSVVVDPGTGRTTRIKVGVNYWSGTIEVGGQGVNGHVRWRDGNRSVRVRFVSPGCRGEPVGD
jgi:hypothetical protein